MDWLEMSQEEEAELERRVRESQADTTQALQLVEQEQDVPAQEYASEDPKEVWQKDTLVLLKVRSSTYDLSSTTNSSLEVAFLFIIGTAVVASKALISTRLAEAVNLSSYYYIVVFVTFERTAVIARVVSCCKLLTLRTRRLWWVCRACDSTRN